MAGFKQHRQDNAKGGQNGNHCRPDQQRQNGALHRVAGAKIAVDHPQTKQQTQHRQNHHRYAAPHIPCLPQLAHFLRGAQHLRLDLCPQRHTGGPQLRANVAANGVGHVRRNHTLGHRHIQPVRQPAHIAYHQRIGPVIQRPLRQDLGDLRVNPRRLHHKPKHQQGQCRNKGEQGDIPAVIMRQGMQRANAATCRFHRPAPPQNIADSGQGKQEDQD